MRYPKSEAGRIILAQTVIAGLIANRDIDTASPVKADAMQARLDGFIAKRNKATMKEAEATQATRDKDEEKALFDDDLKSILRFLELKAKRDRSLLQQFGWDMPSEARESALPGQPRTLEAPGQSGAFLFLDWKEALDGGDNDFYDVERRQLPDGVWAKIDNAYESEITLANQPRGVELEYRVVGVNKAGRSAPSNSVSVVL